MDAVLLSPEEAGKALSVGRSLIYQMLQAGELESIKLGRRRLIPRDAVESFVQRVRAEQGTVQA